MAPTFRKLTGNNLKAAQAAFNTAKRVLQRAGTILASNIDDRMTGLLNDAFGITPNHWLGERRKKQPRRMAGDCW
jgi:hypothetical protein